MYIHQCGKSTGEKGTTVTKGKISQCERDQKIAHQNCKKNAQSNQNVKDKREGWDDASCVLSTSNEEGKEVPALLFFIIKRIFKVR